MTTSKGAIEPKQKTKNKSQDKASKSKNRQRWDDLRLKVWNHLIQESSLHLLPQIEDCLGQPENYLDPIALFRNRNFIDSEKAVKMKKRKEQEKKKEQEKEQEKQPCHRYSKTDGQSISAAPLREYPRHQDENPWMWIDAVVNAVVDGEVKKAVDLKSMAGDLALATISLGVLDRDISWGSYRQRCQKIESKIKTQNEANTNGANCHALGNAMAGLDVEMKGLGALRRLLAAAAAKDDVVRLISKAMVMGVRQYEGVEKTDLYQAAVQSSAHDSRMLEVARRIVTEAERALR